MDEFWIWEMCCSIRNNLPYHLPYIIERLAVESLQFDKFDLVLYRSSGRDFSHQLLLTLVNNWSFIFIHSIFPFMFKRWLRFTTKVHYFSFFFPSNYQYTFESIYAIPFNLLQYIKSQGRQLTSIWYSTRNPISKKKESGLTCFIGFFDSLILFFVNHSSIHFNYFF